MCRCVDGRPMRPDIHYVERSRCFYGRYTLTCLWHTTRAVVTSARCICGMRVPRATCVCKTPNPLSSFSHHCAKCPLRADEVKQPAERVFRLLFRVARIYLHLRVHRLFVPPFKSTRNRSSWMKCLRTYAVKHPSQNAPFLSSAENIRESLHGHRDYYLIKQCCVLFVKQFFVG